MAFDRIRPAVPDDAEELCRLNREFNGTETADTEMIRKSLMHGGIEHCFVCEKNGHLVGFVCGICFNSLCYREPVAQLTELYVQPDARRDGIGRALTETLIRHMRTLGAGEFTLLTGSDNSTAHRLYERCGFRRVEECCYQMYCE